MSAESDTLVGREWELARVGEFLDLAASGPAGLLLEGEMGIGKTALWRAGLAAAADRGQRVLACRPAESEAQFAYAALGDLLGRIDEATLEELPGPQRKALEVALLRAEPEEHESLPRAVALGLLGALHALALQGPTIVAIDDVQWLDHPSESALAFAARRLVDEPIGLLVARRVESVDGAVPELARALPEGRTSILRVGALATEEIDRLVGAALGGRLPRRTVSALHRTSGGNPMMALEIGRAAALRGDAAEAADELPIPASLRALVRDRLGLLPPAAREATEVAAALSRPTVALVAAAGGEVDEAVRAGVLELDGERVRFSHPLLSSVAYVQIPPTQKRRLHARLAELLTEPEERGRHLAVTVEEPDAEVAAALDEAAVRASARGAPDAAAELWEQARRLTPAGDQDEARRRGIEAAERHFQAGGVEHARELLEELAMQAPPGIERARVLVHLGWVRGYQEGFGAGEEVFRAALAEQADDVAVRVAIEEGLAWCVHSTRGPIAAEPHARTALGLAVTLGDAATLSSALSHVAMLESLRGEGLSMSAIQRAIDLAPSEDLRPLRRLHEWIHALFLQWDDELAAARELLEDLHVDAVERGDEHSLPFILFQLARAELLAGSWDDAATHARECRELTVHGEQAGEHPYSLTIGALVDAHRGHVDSARAMIAEGLPLADDRGVQPAACELLAISGFLELSLGDAAAADRALSDVYARAHEGGWGEPGPFRFHGDAVEAKVALGRHEEAEAQLAELEQLGESLDRDWARAVACRCRALLAASRGDLDAAYEALERGLALRERVGQPFEHARTLLALGSTQRRDRKKAPARESLAAALAIFEQLGAAVWAERARAELSRIGGRAPAAGLTPTEEQIAELIAGGRTYQETADALFISPKTVQWNLSKIYRKLGVRSRAELAARFSAERDTPVPR
jgi:DNA-binding CsgD family transcriptional regulator